MTRADIFIGVILAVFSLVAIWQSALLPYGSEFAPGPGFYPLWLAIIGFALSVGIVLTAFLARRDQDTDSSSSYSSGGRSGLLRVGAAFGGMVVMIVLVPFLGLISALFLYLLFLTLAILRLSMREGLGASLGTAGAIYLVFTVALSVPLPTGPLGF